MKLVRDLERRLEHALDSIAGRVFRGRLHASELAVRLVREADLSIVRGPAGISTSNAFTLTLNPEDIGEGGVPDLLVRELEAAIADTAAEKGWRLIGPAHVDIVLDDRVSIGSMDCQSTSIPGGVPAWAELVGPKRVSLTYNSLTVGRAEDNDIRIVEPGISRHHCLIWRESGTAWARDLGSSNGTRIDGADVGERSELISGSRLSMGPTAFVYRTV